MIYDLAGRWNLHEVGSSEWMTAEVPGCNYTDLIANGKIADPYKGLNEKAAIWVAHRVWEYTREFTLPEELMNADEILLKFDMIDTIAEVYVNDRLLGKPNNAHVAWTYDITDIVCKLTNKIRVKLLSPLQYIENMQEKNQMPTNRSSEPGTQHIRKPQCHMGWDFSPTLPPSGILRGVKIEGYGVSRISEVKITQIHNESEVALCINVNTIDKVGAKNLKKRVIVTTPQGKSTKHIITDNAITISIDKPQLWYPSDISDKPTQPMYTLKVELLSGTKLLDEDVRRIGLRTVIVNRQADEYGNNFQFVVNGVPIFAKGTNWIPNENFINRSDSAKLKYMLNAAKSANMNMIRVWGGGYYESDEFYSICDELGLLVWQDLCFNNVPYPFENDDFLNNVKQEVEYNVKRLRHHACLALWCGNNEIEAMSASWLTKRKLIEWGDKFFYRILPEELRKYDAVTPYIEGSPHSGKGYLKKVNHDESGDTHLQAVWHGSQPLTHYRKCLTRFCSQFGIQSLCDVKTMEGFAEPQDLSLKSEVMLARQKLDNGNSKLIYLISSKYRLPQRFEDVVYLSQLVQAECVKDATEHWRRNRGRCNGALYWHFNDCWQAISSSSIDYEGRYKALQYSAKHFNAPQSVSLEDKRGKVVIHAINDLQTPLQAFVTFRLESFSGEIIDNGKIPVDIASTTAQAVKILDYRRKYGIKNLRDKALFVEMTDCYGKLLTAKTCLFSAEKKCFFTDPHLNAEVSVSNETAYITVTAQSFARSVSISVANTHKPLSDNFIDIPAGGAVTLTMPADGLDEDSILRRITLQSVATVEPKGNAFSDWWVRARVVANPKNILRLTKEIIKEML